ncbi:ADP-ribosylation factor-like protein 10 [Tachyglossus aculeatus]|uniref:ADP-ribosylation factor-like protein 10 n=1 Tax=Tachyglossus aculeatus TaxID=9261 RepID=UPI0018F76ECA|nr:ADP-ribosylation factor-like protein 10 [Tachyglossus aculeatus]
MAPRALGPLLLLLLLGLGGAAAAGLASALFVLWKSSRRDPPRDPQQDRARMTPHLRELDRDERQVLVLGLDGAGKSSLLRCLAGQATEGHVAPTWGFNSVRLPTRAFQMDLLEVGGGQNLRFYWKEFLSQADVLVFVVDSADRPRLPSARQELHMLLGEDPDLPVLVVANKQDKRGALSLGDLRQELDLHCFDGQRNIFVLPASVAPAGPGAAAPCVLHVRTLLLELLSRA